MQSAVDSHHKQHEGQHQSRVGGIAEHFAKPGREVRLKSLLDHIKHTLFPTEDKRMSVTECRDSKLKLPIA